MLIVNRFENRFSQPEIHEILQIANEICATFVHLKLNYCKKVLFFSLIHLFARDVLVMKKLEIETIKPTFIISVLKDDS